MKILVIDDDLVVAKAVARMLKENEVVIETDAITAVARLANADLEGEPFEVVVCDFTMHGMTGAEVLAAIHAHRDPPMFILISGRDDLGALTEADAFLSKPFSPTDLRATILRVRAERSRAVTRRIPKSIAA